MRKAQSSQQGIELTNGRRGIRNVPDVPHVSHLTYVTKVQKEGYSREDLEANEQGAMLPAYS